MSPISTWCSHTTPPVSMTRRTTSPRKRRPPGKPPSAGTTSTQSSGSPKFEQSEQQRQRIQRPRLLPGSSAPLSTTRPKPSNAVTSGKITLLKQARTQENKPIHAVSDGWSRMLTVAEGRMSLAKRVRNRTLREMSMLGRLARAKPPGSCVLRHTPGRSSLKLNALACPW